MIDVALKKKLGDFALDAAFASGAGVTCLFGRSGAGKSSVVSAVAGLLKPDEGRIAVNGSVFFDAAARVNVPAEARRVGYVFQDARLFPHMSVLGNLRYGWARAAANERRIEIDAVVALLGLEHLLQRRPYALSGGEAQRVALGRALLAQPRVLLLDEPLAALDAARRQELISYFARIRDEFALPMLYVTHNADEVVQLADHIVLMAQGRVVASGPLEELSGRVDLPAEAEAIGAGAILVATVEGIDGAHGLAMLDTPVGTLRVPSAGLTAGERVRVRIPARDVAIATEVPRAISIRNILPAKVAALHAVGADRLRLKLSAGRGTLLAEITLDAARTLGLGEGREVYALLKSVALGVNAL